MKRIEANARACDSGRARLRAAASSAPAEQMHGVCDRRARRMHASAHRARATRTARMAAARMAAFAPDVVRSHARAAHRRARRQPRRRHAPRRIVRNRRHDSAERQRGHHAERDGFHRDGATRARLRAAARAWLRRAFPARSDARRAMPGRRRERRQPARRSRTNASRRAGSPPGIALHCNARRQTSDARAFTSARARARTRAPNTATAARSRRATFERTRGRPGASGRPCARIGRLIDRRTACPPSPTNRAAPR
ncbi:Uncharacterised protein [Burkholderia pseudomallei]|nr:Uncharacterised protein [Burkholderia pseudomallei]